MRDAAEEGLPDDPDDGDRVKCGGCTGTLEYAADSGEWFHVESAAELEPRGGL